MNMRRVLPAAVLLFAVLLAGTMGYWLVEGWNILDSFYQTVITLSTVGFGEVHPLSDAGKLLTVGLIIGSIGIVTYAATLIGRIIVEGEVQQIFQTRRMEKTLKDMRDHFILCGYGRMGLVAADRLRQDGHRLVIVEKSPDAAQRARNAGYIVVEGDATQEEVLQKAGIARAKGVAALLPDDPDNLYLTITARNMNPKVLIAAKAMTEAGALRMTKVGVDKVIPLYHLGGMQLATALSRPEVMNFLDVVAGHGQHVRIDQVLVPEGCKLLGQSLADLDLRGRFGITVLAVKRGQDIFSASPETVLQPGDIALVMGPADKLDGFERQLRPAGK